MPNMHDVPQHWTFGQGVVRNELFLRDVLDLMRGSGCVRRRDCAEMSSG